MDTVRFSLRDLPKLIAILLTLLLGFLKIQQRMAANHAELGIKRVENGEEVDRKAMEMIRRIVESPDDQPLYPAGQPRPDKDQPAADTELPAEPS